MAERFLMIKCSRPFCNGDIIHADGQFKCNLCSRPHDIDGQLIPVTIGTETRTTYEHDKYSHNRKHRIYSGRMIK